MSRRFVDLATAEVYATMLDEGRYPCSERTMFRAGGSQAPVRYASFMGCFHP